MYPSYTKNYEETPVGFPLTSVGYFPHNVFMAGVYKSRHWGKFLKDRSPDAAVIKGYEKWYRGLMARGRGGRDSTFHPLKFFEKDFYFAWMDPFLSSLPKGAKILEAGCGTGRFACELLKRGYRVTFSDTSPSALKLTASAVKRSKIPASRYKALLLDIKNMREIKDNTYDVAVAMEVICYTKNFRKALRELVRVTKPDGFVFLSVEGKYGSILGDDKITLKNFKETYLKGSYVERPGFFVRYFTRSELTHIMEKEGLRVLLISGSHFIPEGPLNRWLDGMPLKKGHLQKKLIGLEQMMAKDPVLGELGRAWVAVGRKSHKKIEN